MRIRYPFQFANGSAALLLLVLYSFAQAQTSTTAAPNVKALPPSRVPTSSAPRTVAGETELYCAGFIEYAPSPNYLEVVGGEEEQEQRTYGQGDFVFINAGSQQGMRLGNEYVVIRPRGQFKSILSKKDGWLGVYTQEVARLRVTEVKDNVAVALVTHSCEVILSGDLLRAVYPRVAPPEEAQDEFDRFADPSGKQRGRIVLARDGREMLSRSQIVYIDLGAEDDVKTGDRLTIYRPAGRGNISRFKDEEVTPTANYGFESEIFRGGKFSNKAQRVKDPNGTGIYGPTVTTPDVVRRRPPVPRKVVGEMIILNAQKRTATAIITRVAQEIHTGDFVEVK